MRKWPILGLCLLVSETIAQPDSILSISINRITQLDIAAGHHVGFPRVVRLPNDSLLISYRKGVSHVDMSGKMMKRFGSPDGLSWSAEQLLFDDTLFDDKGANFLVKPDGSLFMHFFKYKLGNTMVFPPVPSLFSIFASKSYDNGHTFSTPYSIDGGTLSLPPGNTFNGSKYLDSTGAPLESFAINAPALFLNNKIVIPAYGGETPVYLSSLGCFSTEPERLVFFESVDEVNWAKRYINETELPGSWLLEPYMVDLGNNEILMHFRNSDNTCLMGGNGPMRQVISLDNGQTFSNYTDFPFVGQAPSIYKLSSGVLLSGFRWYNDSMTVQKTAFVYSTDFGQSWSDTILVGTCWTECGYPDFVELSGNSFLLVYYTSFGNEIRAVKYTLDIEYDNSAGIADNSLLNHSLTVYPNPSSGIFSILSADFPPGNGKLNIYSAGGSLVYSSMIQSSIPGLNHSVTLADFSPGIHFIEVCSESYVQRRKIVLY